MTNKVILKEKLDFDSYLFRNSLSEEMEVMYFGKSTKHFTVLLMIVSSSLASEAQTCCSGGVPISSSLGLPPEEKNTIQFNLNYDLNVLKTLKEGTEDINDESRTRRTHSILLQSGYSFTQKLSMDLLFSYVKQERNIEQFNQQNLTTTSGIGDGLVLLKYKLLGNSLNNTSLTGALGIKVPLGRSDLKNENGITINADLQPGSGAWDGVAWLQYFQTFKFRPTLVTSGTIVFSKKGKNNDYLGSQAYQFGDELQLTVSIADRLLIGTSIFDPSISLRYRYVLGDRLNEQQIPNTGGNWLFIRPTVKYWFNPSTALNFQFELPLYANVEGTQLSPTYRYNLGIYKKLNLAHQSTPDNGYLSN